MLSGVRTRCVRTSIEYKTVSIRRCSLWSSTLCCFISVIIVVFLLVFNCLRQCDCFGAILHAVHFGPWTSMPPNPTWFPSLQKDATVRCCLNYATVSPQQFMQAYQGALCFFFLFVILDYPPTGSNAAQKRKHPKEKGTSWCWLLVVVVVFYFFVGDLIPQTFLLKELCRYRSG